MVLVQWKGLPEYESTWELARLIHQHFPEFQLEDKLNLLAGRDGKTPVLTYYRRKRNRINKGGSSGTTGERVGRATSGGLRWRLGREAGLSERDCPYRLFVFVLYLRYSELFIYGVSFSYGILILEITESFHDP